MPASKGMKSSFSTNIQANPEDTERVDVDVGEESFGSEKDNL
jgi:hypothetical protein